METLNHLQTRTFKTKCYKGIERTVYEAKINNTTYQCFSIEALQEKVDNHTDFKIDASSFYGAGTYNGD